MGRENGGSAGAPLDVRNGAFEGLCIMAPINSDYYKEAVASSLMLPVLYSRMER